MSVNKWVGIIPSSWPLARIKHVCRTAGGGTPDKGKPEYWQGDIPWVSPKDMKSDRIIDTVDHITPEGLSNSATQIVPPNSVLLVMRSGILRHSIPVAINEIPVSLNQDMRAFLPDERLEPRFLARLIQGHQAELLQAWSKVGATVESLESDLIGDTLIPLPPRREQEVIEKFLDRETARLDALVAAKQRFLDLLAEKRKAIIATAVTRGLDPNVKLRDSGVPWLGEIPAHWRVIRTGLTGSILMGRQRAPQYEKGEHIRPYLRVANVFDGYIDFGDVLEMNFDPMEQVIFDIRPNDILLNEGQSRELVGRSAIYKGEPNQYCFQNTLIRFRCGPNLLAGFAQVQFSNWLQHGVFQAFSRQSTNIAHLGADRLAQIRMAVPPVEEQHAIVDHIERETARLDAVRTATERTIALLKERRSALIAAAVTGQIDVASEI